MTTARQDIQMMQKSIGHAPEVQRISEELAKDFRSPRPGRGVKTLPGPKTRRIKPPSYSEASEFDGLQFPSIPLKCVS